MATEHRIQVEQYDEAWVHERYPQKRFEDVEKARVAGRLAGMCGQDIPWRIPEDVAWIKMI
jgi:hypothetical protein